MANGVFLLSVPLHHSTCAVWHNFLPPSYRSTSSYIVCQELDYVHQRPLAVNHGPCRGLGPFYLI